MERPSPVPRRLDRDEWLSRPETQAVFLALSAGGREARAVGGAVRNALMNRPVTDIDIATTAPPKETMQLAHAAGLGAVPTGLDHGTVTVVSGGIPFEVTTLREDVETYGRHAKVAFTDDWAADARRRDFTINALYCDAQGTVHDPLGGYPDLIAGRVRFIGDARARIREDYLRILRFFRFHAEYAETPPDRSALDACVAERRGLDQLAGERISRELMRLLKSPRAPNTVEVMREWGLLTELLPIAPRPELLRRLVYAEDALGSAPDATLRLAALGIEVPEDALRLRDRLKLSTADTAKLMRAAKSNETEPLTDETGAKVFLYRHGPAALREHLLLSRARWGNDVAEPDPATAALFSLPERWMTPRLPLQGADIVSRGVAPGPRVGEILRQLEEWWIAAGFPDGRPGLEAKLEGLLQSNPG